MQRLQVCAARNEYVTSAFIVKDFLTPSCCFRGRLVSIGRSIQI